MGKFRQWYLTYQAEITWFVIGVLFSSCLTSLARGDYLSALIDIGLGYINYYFWRENVR